MERITDTLKILTDEDKQNLDLPKITENENSVGKRKLYIESYGCQMNFADSEIVVAILREDGFATTSNIDEAELILLNTCAIRENAEQKVRNRLVHLTPMKKRRPNVKIGILGCMAERLKTKLLDEEKIVDMVVGPDAYRDLPKLVLEAESGMKGVNTFLSREETYADITPIRLDSNGVTAMISIMRGCDNMCSFCVVPYTRGRERSRDPQTIIKEATDLFNQGYREVILLGQNVDSYKAPQPPEGGVLLNDKNSPSGGWGAFAWLLEQVAQINPELRVRFSTSHPKDITDEVLYTIKKYDNICNYIHLPAQSGNNRILELMNRTYTREWYIERIDKIREVLGEECGISQDMIAGFCSETEEEHQDSLSLIKYVKFDLGYMFSYSERPGTPAAKKLKDDVPEDVKSRRLAEIIAVQREVGLERNKLALNKVHKVLIEGFSKRSQDFFAGKNDQSKVIIFPKENFRKGDYVNVLVTDCSSGTLFGHAVQEETIPI